jgi:hypothetical protein
MDEGKRTNPAAATPPAADDADTGAQTAARHEEATSSNTLKDLQQADSTASPGETASSDSSSSAPSPDGMLGNADGETADGKDSGGPM